MPSNTGDLGSEVLQGVSCSSTRSFALLDFIYTWQEDSHGRFSRIPFYGPRNETASNVPAEAAEEFAAIIIRLEAILDEQDHRPEYSTGYLLALINGNMS